MRIKNRKLLDSYQGIPCLICGSEESTAAHHLISKGASGPDIEWNLMELCWQHHALIHKSRNDFINEHIEAWQFMVQFGWKFISESRKWIHPDFKY